MLLCSLSVPAKPVSGSYAHVPAAVKWDPDKRDEFRLLLKSPENKSRRADLMTALRSKVLSVTDVSRQWGEIILEAARAVFGSEAVRTRKGLHGGRKAKRWF